MTDSTEKNAATIEAGSIGSNRDTNLAGIINYIYHGMPWWMAGVFYLGLIMLAMGVVWVQGRPENSAPPESPETATLSEAKDTPPLASLEVTLDTPQPFISLNTPSPTPQNGTTRAIFETIDGQVRLRWETSPPTTLDLTTWAIRDGFGGIEWRLVNLTWYDDRAAPINLALNRFDSRGCLLFSGETEPTYIREMEGCEQIFVVYGVATETWTAHFRIMENEQERGVCPPLHNTEGRCEVPLP